MDDSDSVEHLRLLSNDEVSRLMFRVYPSAAAARACAVSALITDASSTFAPPREELITESFLEHDSYDFIEQVDEVLQLATVSSPSTAF